MNIVTYNHNQQLWSELLCCVKCRNVFARTDLPVNLGCSHLMCENCTKIRGSCCPLDKTEISKIPSFHYINGPVLSIVIEDKNLSWLKQPTLKSSGDKESRQHLEKIEPIFYQFADYLHKMNSEKGATVYSNRISRTIQRKLLSLLCANVLVKEGRIKLLNILRSMSERIVSELVLRVHCISNLSSSLWSAVRARGCQFLGPAMQEDVLKLIRHTMQKGENIARKTLVIFVVNTLLPDYPHISKTCVGHVVQLLYRASCFNVIKREDQSSLMQLKEQFRNFDALRAEHDTQIVQIAMESGLRISADQWSSLLYGDSRHRVHMQSICDRLSCNSLKLAVDELRKLVSQQPPERDLFGIHDVFAHFDVLIAEGVESAEADIDLGKIERMLKSFQSILAQYSQFVQSWKADRGLRDLQQPEQQNENHNYVKSRRDDNYKRPNFPAPSSGGAMLPRLNPPTGIACRPPPLPLLSSPTMANYIESIGGIGSPPNFMPPPLSLSPLQSFPSPLQSFPMGIGDSMAGPYMQDSLETITTTLLPVLQMPPGYEDQFTSGGPLMPDPSSSPTIYNSRPFIVFGNNATPPECTTLTNSPFLGPNQPPGATAILSTSPPTTYQFSPGGLITTNPPGLMSTPAFTIPVQSSQSLILYGSTPPVSFPYGSPPLLFPQWVTPLDTGVSFAGLFGPSIMGNNVTSDGSSFRGHLGLGESSYGSDEDERSNSDCEVKPNHQQKSIKALCTNAGEHDNSE